MMVVDLTSYFTDCIFSAVFLSHRCKFTGGQAGWFHKRCGGTPQEEGITPSAEDIPLLSITQKEEAGRGG